MTISNGGQLMALAAQNRAAAPRTRDCKYDFASIASSFNRFQDIGKQDLAIWHSGTQPKIVAIPCARTRGCIFESFSAMNNQRFAPNSALVRARNVPPNQLQHAIAAADYGSFRQAAEVLSVKQSTLSRSIQLLEHRFGATIFERSRGGVRATQTGRQFLLVARSILEQLDALAAITHAAGQGEAGRLTLGFCTSLTAGNLRASLLDFRRQFPEVELSAIERRRTHLATTFRNGLIDVLILTGGMSAISSNIRPLWNERILVVLPADHALATREIVYWTDLRGQTVILSEYDPGREMEDLLVSKLVSAEDRPKIERHDI